eukprot:COSAG06_NODE_4770_length_3967_cov_1.789555_2_plen_244_part_00
MSSMKCIAAACRQLEQAQIEAEGGRLSMVNKIVQAANRLAEDTEAMKVEGSNDTARRSALELLEQGLGALEGKKSLTEVAEHIEADLAALPGAAGGSSSSGSYLQPEEPPPPADYLMPEEPDGLLTTAAAAGGGSAAGATTTPREPEVEPASASVQAAASRAAVAAAVATRARDKDKLKLHSDTAERIKAMCAEARSDLQTGGGEGGGGKTQRGNNSANNAKKQNAQTPFKLTVLPSSSNKRW